jgi:hypothetical protein
MAAKNHRRALIQGEVEIVLFYTEIILKMDSMPTAY